MLHRVRLDSATVIEAAAKLLDEEGVEQLTLSRLAECLAIRTPSLYNHVAGLTGLKHDLTIYCLRDLLDHLLRATSGKARGEAIIALADAYRAYGRETPGRYIFSLQAPDSGEPDILVIAQQVVDVAQAVLAPYALEGEEAIHAIRSLRSIVHGFIALELVGGFGMPVDTNASFHWLINLFIAGLSRPTVSGE